MSTLTSKEFEEKVAEYGSYEKLHEWLVQHAEDKFLACEPRKCPLAAYFGDKLGEPVVVGVWTVRQDDDEIHSPTHLSKLLAQFAKYVDRNALSSKQEALTGTEAVAILELAKLEYDQGLL